MSESPMYRLSVPLKKKKVLDIMDCLVSTKSVVIPDVNTTRNVGIYIKPWRKMGFVSLYIEPEQKRTILVSNVDIDRNIRGYGGKRVEFTIDDRLVSKLFPRIPRL